MSSSQDDVLRILKRRWMIFGAIFFVQILFALALAYFANQARENTIVVRVLEQQNAAIQAQQALSSRQFNIFLVAFIREQNYACNILSAQATAENLKIPNEDVCKVKIPGS